MTNTHRIHRPFALRVTELPPFVVAYCSGGGPGGTFEDAARLAAELLRRDGERLVLELSALAPVPAGIARTLAEALTEAQRLGRNVCLVRCSQELYRGLQSGGMRGAVRHSVSLRFATDGLIEDGGESVELHLRSTPELLHRLRSVAAGMARSGGLSAADELDLVLAVNEAASNAIRHGSPDGSRNHVRVAFLLEPGRVIVDVADQGPGFDPDAVVAPVAEELPECGFGLQMMRRAVDRVEYYRDDPGMLVRLTKLLPTTGAAPLLAAS